MEGKSFGISGSTLKIIALLTMTIDHIGAVLIQRFILTPGFDTNFWQSLYMPFRNIGRIAFPIFCFLLVEGFVHTQNRGKYLIRMILFALISEIPFNLALKGEIWVKEYQNVFWELALGILLMILLEKIENTRVNYFLKFSLTVLFTIIVAIVGELLCFDYGQYGIVTIAVLYYFRRFRSLQLIAGGASFLWSWKAIFAFLPIAFYNGKRGRQIKYAFYIFYPAHLLLFYIISKVAGCIY
ncbi:MAG: conjugal transfer protein TraX [Lachnospiraceae bacterium]|nr:conjugal transfer protein TraX [Lachnospiraceae bacterium]